MGSNYFMPTATNTMSGGNFNFGYNPNTSSNQYGSGYPSPGQSIPMPGSQAGAVPSTTNQQNTTPLPTTQNTQPGWSNYIGAGQHAVPPADQPLQSTEFNYLQSQVGQGITPYGLSAALPTGGTSGAGQVASPLDPVTQQLMNFFTSGTSSNPALNSLQSLATTGDPVDQTPAWQAMVNAAQNQINEGGADVREQMAFTGNLPGSSGAQAISDYYTNANSQLTSQLVSAQTQAQQQAVQNQLAASTALQGQEQSLGSSLYGYDQNAITQLMNEYFQTTPQENPLNQEMFSGATTYAPTFGKSSTSGALGTLAGDAGSLIGDAASGISGGLSAAGGGSGLVSSILSGLAAF